MPLPDEDLLDKNFPDDDGRRAGKKIMGAVAIVIALIFVGGITLFYFMTGDSKTSGDLPVITENNPPERFKPEDPGGMEIPHQDATVYDQVGAEQMANEPEKLLPEPEAPVTATAANTATNPVAGDEVAAPEKLETAEVPTQLEGLPAPKTETAKAEENPAAPDVKAETKETAPEKVTEEKGVEVTPQPKVAETATNEFRIQLGAVKTEELAKAEWTRISGKSPEALKGLEPHYSSVNLGDKGTYLRIQTTPLAREDAEARCEKLKQANQACLIVRAVE